MVEINTKHARDMLQINKLKNTPIILLYYEKQLKYFLKS